MQPINHPKPTDFIDNDLSLFYYSTPRAIVQAFRENKTTANGRLCFDYLMLNYSKKLNHTHKINLTEIANWLGCGIRTVQREIAHLKKIDAIRHHPDKISVYFIPCLDELRDTLHDYRLAVKEQKLQEQIAERITEMEFDLDRPLNEREKVNMEKDIRRDNAYKERSRQKKQHAKTQFSEELPFESR